MEIINTGYNTGKPRTAIPIQGLLEVPIASIGELLLPPYLPPLHCRPPRRVLPVEDGHPCYVEADWQGSYFLVTPTKPWALSELGHRLSVIVGDRRETAFLFQRLSVCIQRI